MRIAEPPSLNSPRRGHSGDDLDGLLSSFFRAEMPEPWPALELPAEETVLPILATPRPHRWRTFRTRLALAASVAIFLVGAWLIGGSLTHGTRTVSGAKTTDNASDTDRPKYKKSHGSSSGEPHIRKESLKLDQDKKTRLELEFDNDGVLPQ